MFYQDTILCYESDYDAVRKMCSQTDSKTFIEIFSNSEYDEWIDFGDDTYCIIFDTGDVYEDIDEQSRTTFLSAYTMSIYDWDDNNEMSRCIAMVCLPIAIENELIDEIRNDAGFIEKVLLLGLALVLFEEDDIKEQLCSLVEDFDIAKFSITSLCAVATLGGYHFGESEAGRAIYDALAEYINDIDRDVLFWHYVIEDEMFVENHHGYTLDEVLDIAYRENELTGRDIWLWCCDGGLANEGDVSIAQKMANATNQSVLAALGSIILFISQEDGFLNTGYNYLVADCRDTRWQDRIGKPMGKFEFWRLKRYLKKHEQQPDEEWQLFTPEE